MQLSSRILTALAVLILAVAVVAVRGGSSGTVEAATGTIDVLNVGTCYTTNSDVFAVANCDDGDGNPEGTSYEVTGRDSISEVGTVFATYSHDPKTAADNPRGILKNSDLIKISIQDSDRDKRTPVLLRVSNTDADTAAGFQISQSDLDVITGVFGNIDMQEIDDPADPASITAAEARMVGGSAVTAETITYSEATDGTKTYYLAEDRWDDDTTDSNVVPLPAGVTNGLRVILADGSAYLPMHAGDNAVIKFFGCLDGDATNTADGACGGTGDGPFKDLSGTLPSLVLDEDRGSGRTADEDGGAVAPWLNVQVNAPATASTLVLLQYIVYYTSERETLIGGKSIESPGADPADATDYPTSDSAGNTVHAPDFPRSEREGNSALTVKVKSDGDASEQHLWLYETGRFTGRYEGYARLTDADGDGRGDDPTAPPNNWGLDVGAAMGSDINGAAVIGVESGPVTIEYRDTDGHVQTKTITIDTVPPAIQIDTPAHKSEDQDTSPEFAGSFNDSESGLRQTSFQLYVDNTNDSLESGDGITSQDALNLDLDMGGLYGYVGAPAADDELRDIEDYQGYPVADTSTADEQSQFGVIDHMDVYKDETLTLLTVGGDRYSDGATNGTFANSVRIRILDSDGEEVEPYNNTIDFQALVADRAGNIGFSDSDDAGPRLINDFGTEDDDRKTGRYNVLGWYARHIFFLDEKDPEVYREQSVTGFYGINDSKKPAVNRSGVLIVFDSAVDADTIGVGTFEVMNGDASATVTDVTVEGNQVYLLLGEELASDATPSVHIASGQAILDPAGNRLTRGGLATAGGPIEVNDGIAPILTVTLSGGSGTGEGNEASDKLTNKAMTITVASDEEVNSTPSLAVVCSNIEWDSNDDDENDKGLSDFTGARSGPIKGQSSDNFDQPAIDCGELEDAQDRLVEPLQTFSRPGLEWEYQWQNFGERKMMPNGKLTVVAYARDRQSYASPQGRNPATTPAANDTYNWGVATAEFNLDTEAPDLDPTPGNKAVVTDPRPFLLLNYKDATTVSVSKLTVDDTEQTEQVQTLGAKRFLYWPESLALGSHNVAVEAVDAAGNKGSDEYSFEVAERATFDVKLIAGWNAVSFPANPLDPSVGSVFTEPIVDMIAAWDGENPEAPWSIATRMEGEWSTHSNFATLGRITARYGYWVHAQGFVTQSVALIGKQNREDPNAVPADLVEIPTNPGWNFVGVVDQDGDQTQDNYGEALKNGDTKVKASDYLGSHVRAYSWDAIRNRFDILEGDETVTIGEGIWVYYGGGIAP